jgi:PIN domain nuclease of toxin-antitoxin system
MIPIEFRKQLGLGEGSELIVRIEDGELRLHTRQQALERARRIFGAFKRSGESATGAGGIVPRDSAIPIVLDSSAMLAVLYEEVGSAAVEQSLGQSAISAVNYAEVITRQVREGHPPEIVLELLRGLELMIIEWDQKLAEASADLCSLAWTHGLSLGDRACIATARHFGAPVLTADRAWSNLPDLGVRIQVIR